MQIINGNLDKISYTNPFNEIKILIDDMRTIVYFISTTDHLNLIDAAIKILSEKSTLLQKLYKQFMDSNIENDTIKCLEAAILYTNFAKEMGDNDLAAPAFREESYKVAIAKVADIFICAEKFLSNNNNTNSDEAQDVINSLNQAFMICAYCVDRTKTYNDACNLWTKLEKICPQISKACVISAMFAFNMSDKYEKVFQLSSKYFKSSNSEDLTEKFSGISSHTYYYNIAYAYALKALKEKDNKAENLNQAFENHQRCIKICESLNIFDDFYYFSLCHIVDVLMNAVMIAKDTETCKKIEDNIVHLINKINRIDPIKMNEASLLDLKIFVNYNCARTYILLKNKDETNSLEYIKKAIVLLEDFMDLNENANPSLDPEYAHAASLLARQYLDYGEKVGNIEAAQKSIDKWIDVTIKIIDVILEGVADTKQITQALANIWSIKFSPYILDSENKGSIKPELVDIFSEALKFYHKYKNYCSLYQGILNEYKKIHQILVDNQIIPEEHQEIDNIFPQVSLVVLFGDPNGQAIIPEHINNNQQKQLIGVAGNNEIP